LNDSYRNHHSDQSRFDGQLLATQCQDLSICEREVLWNHIIDHRSSISDQRSAISDQRSAARLPIGYTIGAPKLEADCLRDSHQLASLFELILRNS
jgi:hypothetical protein